MLVNKYKSKNGQEYEIKVPVPGVDNDPFIVVTTADAREVIRMDVNHLETVVDIFSQLYSGTLTENAVMAK